jgi:hypothetical protein
MAGLVVRMGDNRSAYKVLVGKSEGKRPLRISKSRWEDDVKWILKKQNGGWLWIESRGGLF